MRLITDTQEKNQAALEAIELLNDAGFNVDSTQINADHDSPWFRLDLALSLAEDERPLA